jgi:hypothetical protein
MTKPKMSWDGRTLTVHVPLAFRKRGGRKIIIAPQGAEAWAPPRPGVDNTLVKALARGVPVAKAAGNRYAHDRRGDSRR